VAGTAVVALGCGEKQPPAPERVYEVWTSDKPAEPELTIEEQRAKLEAERANQPEPELDPESPREKQELVWGEGKSTLEGIYEERSNIVTQMKSIQFDDKITDQKEKFAPLLEAVQRFGLGAKREDLDSAAERFCKRVDELMTAAGALESEGEAKLEEIDKAIAELEAKQAEGKPVTTRQYENLEAERKLWSAPVLGARYVYMVMRTIFDEVYVLVDLGARRSQLTVRDCLSKEDAKSVPYELAEEARQKPLKRSRYYLP
jgi:hypothetical protein